MELEVAEKMVLEVSKKVVIKREEWGRVDDMILGWDLRVLRD